MTALFDKFLNICLLVAFLGLVAVFACDPPTKKAEEDQEITFEVDPNDLLVFTKPIVLTMTVGDPEHGTACELDHVGNYTRGAMYQAMNCAEFRVAMENINSAHPDFAPGAACWLMDPCRCEP